MTAQRRRTSRSPSWPIRARQGQQTLFTIAHSTFGHQVVGDYDTDLATGNAFIYDI